MRKHWGGLELQNHARFEFTWKSCKSYNLPMSIMRMSRQVTRTRMSLTVLLVLLILIILALVEVLVILLVLVVLGVLGVLIVPVILILFVLCLTGPCASRWSERR